MNEEEYIKERLNGQLKWYSEKSAKFQKKYKIWQMIKVIAALLIPLLIFLMEGYPDIKYAISILGAFIAFIESYLKIYNYRELWNTYRATLEKLKREKVFFLTKTGIYKTNKDSFELFVTNCEQVMKSENTIWDNITNQKSTDD